MRKSRAVRVDPKLGFYEELRRIRLSDVDFQEHLPSLPRKDLITKYRKMSRKTMPPVLAYGKRPKHPKDKFRIYDGHHRGLAAMQRGDRTIKAWVLKVEESGLADISQSRRKRR